jgi:hypothetical protein
MKKTAKAANDIARKRQRFVKRAECLRREIDSLEDTLFSVNERDPELRCKYLKTFRTEIMRSFVLSLHLAIEVLLRAILFDFVARQNRRLTKKETIRIVNDLRSADLIHWCGRLNLLTARQYEALRELNRIRNACAHHWLLDLPSSKRIGPKGKQKRITVPAVSYQNTSLFAQRTFVDDFSPLYSGLYLKLLFRVWKMQGKL